MAGVGRQDWKTKKKSQLSSRLSLIVTETAVAVVEVDVLTSRNVPRKRQTVIETEVPFRVASLTMHVQIGRQLPTANTCIRLPNTVELV